MCPLGRPLLPTDVPFERVPVVAYSSSGLPYTRWATYGMPKLGEYQYLLDIVFFLYPNEDSARAGEHAGGTGFFVAIPSESAPAEYHHMYAVTNWHVAVHGGNSVIRVNRREGATEIMPFEPHEWEFIPGDHDIAVLPVRLDQTALKIEAIEAESFFLTEQLIASLEINAAEDVFTLGRFVDHDGIEANKPSMRFGNISMMEAVVKQPNGFIGPSIVVDMHSRTGFSGSPVFVYRTGGSIFSTGTLGVGHVLKLLGILWGQFPEAWDIHDKPAPMSQNVAILDGKQVSGWSGMSLVSPASAIWKALHTPKIIASRAAMERLLHIKYKGSPIAMNPALPSATFRRVKTPPTDAE